MESTNPVVRSVFNLLKYTFVVVPIVAGIDKFTNILVDWTQYVPSAMAGIISVHTLMMIVGIIEIVAGLLVLTKPKVGGMIGAAWLALISLILLVSGQYIDTGIRDMVMAIAAFSMARLATVVS